MSERTRLHELLLTPLAPKPPPEIGLGHPDPEIAFEIELEILEGEAFDVAAGLRSQWPFWARLSKTLKHGRANAWFGKPEHEEFLRKCERHLTHGEPLPFQT